MRKRLLTDVQVESIKKKIASGSTKVEMAREYGVSPQLISVVCKFGYGERPKYGYKNNRQNPKIVIVGKLLPKNIQKLIPTIRSRQPQPEQRMTGPS